jgi:hypothetical protein
MPSDNISKAARALGRKGGSSKSKAKQSSSRENGKAGGRPPKYKQFVSYGFLRVHKWDAVRKVYTQIGSFAGPDAIKNADARIAEDKRRDH